MSPAPHQKIIMGKVPTTLASRLPALWSPTMEDVPAGQANGGGHQQEIERRQQTLLQIAPRLQKGGMKHGVESQNAPQQRSEFSEFQNHRRHSRGDPLDFMPFQPPAGGCRAMGK